MTDATAIKNIFQIPNLKQGDIFQVKDGFGNSVRYISLSNVTDLEGNALYHDVDYGCDTVCGLVWVNRDLSGFRSEYTGQVFRSLDAYIESIGSTPDLVDGTPDDDDPEDAGPRVVDWGGLGGAPGGRDLDLSNPFEVALFIEFAERVRADTDCAEMLWDALADVKWTHASGDTATCSYRRAGDIVAAIRRSAPKCADRNGDYCDWYRSSGGIVSAEIADAMADRGWTFEVTVAR